MMRNTFFLLFLLVGTSVIGQDLTCKDFKEGTFKAELLGDLKVGLKIVRQDNRQVEIPINIPKELLDLGVPTDPVHIIIEWIDDCNYRAIFDEEKSELTESRKMINDAGGILTELVKIVGRCFYYKSTLIVGENKQVLEGKICKE